MATTLLDQPERIQLAVPDPQPKPMEPAQPSLYRFAFTGNAREYFGIWIVNILLSVITLGIYSPWATVRARSYFYGNTILDGAAFGYHARPTQILKGRLIAIGVFCAYVLIVAFYPWLDLLWSLVILPAAVPWIVVRALRFRRRVSSHRNIRFGFAGTMREAFEIYIVLPIGAVLTAGLLHPHAIYRRRRYLVEHSRFGQTEFRFDGRSSGFYKPYAWVVATPIALIGLVVGLVHALDLHHSLRFLLLLEQLEEGAAEVGGSVVWMAVLAAGILLAYTYLSARIENYAWSHTRLGADRFAMDLEFGRLLWIYLTNVLAISVTVGLMIPWAQVRLARYRLSRLFLESVAEPDGHMADGPAPGSATGEELGDTFDVDIGL
jgi:uncharacterized membrane protein YjgN (DUF898 family)